MFRKMSLCSVLSFVAAVNVAGQTSVLNEDQKIQSSDGALSNDFGFHVDASDDVFIVGAPGSADLGVNAGAAYVYRWNGVAWVEEQKLLPSDGAPSDFFGKSVAISGNVAVVGADADNDLGILSGSAYVFHWDGSSWIQAQKLLPTDGAAGDRFGTAVGIHDGVIAVSAALDDDNGTNSGSAYIFEWSGASWVQVQKVSASDGASDDRFGVHVAVGSNVIAIGAPLDDDNGLSAGAAYLYRRGALAWFEEQKLNAPDGSAADQFGWEVAVDGNIAVAGAPGDDDLGGQAGSAYVYRWNGSAWSFEQKLLAFNGSSDGFVSNEFGSAVSISEDAILVGAHGHRWNHLLRSGVAYVYRWNGSNWTGDVVLAAADASAEDQLGWSVALDGTFAVVGARTSDQATTGTVYTFSLVPPDNDADGLTDADEIDLWGTDPFDSDTDEDGLFDGTEVEMMLANGDGCPDPLVFDSDGEGLGDGDEVLVVGTDPCNPDTDGDGLDDAIDPTPLDPGATGEFLEEFSRDLGDAIENLDLGLFNGANSNANEGRVNSLANRLRNAASAIADGDYATAIDILSAVLAKVDGDSAEPDWMDPSADQQDLADEIALLIALLLLE